MAVDGEVRLARRPGPVGDHNWIAIPDDFDDLDLHAQGHHAIAKPLGVADAITAPLRQGADRRDAELFHEVSEVAVAGRLRLRQRGVSESVCAGHYDRPRERSICMA